MCILCHKISVMAETDGNTLIVYCYLKTDNFRSVRVTCQAASHHPIISCTAHCDYLKTAIKSLIKNVCLLKTLL